MRLLVSLHLLLLLRVFLLHLLSLLLVFLFHLLLHLLLPRSVLLLLLQFLMFLILLLLKFLVFPYLLVIELLLLLLIFLVLLLVPGAGRRWTLMGLNIVRMDWMGILALALALVTVAISASRSVRRSRRRIVIPSCAGGYHSAFVERRRLGSSSDRRLAAIYRSMQLLIGARGLDVLSLRGDGRNVTLTHGRLLLWAGAYVDTAVTTVVADARGIIIVHHGGVVHVVDFRHVHVVHGAVIIEAVVVPASSLITVAEITVSIVDAAVKSYDRSPKALMKNKSAATPTPPTRGPQETDLRGKHPRARHPVVVIAILVPGPVTGRPDISFGGAGGLFVNWQFRRSKRHRYPNADLCEARA